MTMDYRTYNCRENQWYSKDQSQWILEVIAFESSRELLNKDALDMMLPIVHYILRRKGINWQTKKYKKHVKKASRDIIRFINRRSYTSTNGKMNEEELKMTTLADYYIYIKALRYYRIEDAPIFPDNLLDKVDNITKIIKKESWNNIEYDNIHKKISKLV